MLNCCRQSGKSTTTAAMALLSAWFDPGLCLLLSPSQRQANELLSTVKMLNAGVDSPIPLLSDIVTGITFSNGSRILSLPSSEGTVRCYSSVRLLVFDEASWIEDGLYTATLPMIAVSKGRVMALSTPYLQRGWFHQEWVGSAAWTRVRITAAQCPRLDPQMLAEFRASRGERLYAREFLGEFGNLSDACIFRPEDLQAAVALGATVEPLFEELAV